MVNKRIGLQIVLGATAVAVGAALGFGFVAFTLIAIMGIFLSLSHRSGSGQRWSAYSVFNPGYKALPGDVSLQQLERQMVGGLAAATTRPTWTDFDPSVLHGHHASKEASLKELEERLHLAKRAKPHELCPCKSGKKVKRCCGDPRLQTAADKLRLELRTERFAGYGSSSESENEGNSSRLSNDRVRPSNEARVNRSAPRATLTTPFLRWRRQGHS